jgi:hypothetical protein
MVGGRDPGCCRSVRACARSRRRILGTRAGRRRSRFARRAPGRRGRDVRWRRPHGRESAIARGRVARSGGCAVRRAALLHVRSLLRADGATLFRRRLTPAELDRRGRRGRARGGRAHGAVSSCGRVGDDSRPPRARTHRAACGRRPIARPYPAGSMKAATGGRERRSGPRHPVRPQPRGAAARESARGGRASPRVGPESDFRPGAGPPPKRPSAR